MSAVDLTAWTGDGGALAGRILRFIDASLAGQAHEAFSSLALDIHKYQASGCPVIASLVDGPVVEWTDVPAVPVDLFKQLPVGLVDPDEAAVTFMTSGTTGGGRGQHRLRSTALYDHGAVAWAKRCMATWPSRTVNLLLDPAAHPESSLSHMVASFASVSSWHLGPDGVDSDGVLKALRAGPAFIGATAFALAEWLEDHHPPPLPPGCTLMVTGGFKGRIHRLDAADLYQAAQAVLRPDHLVTEYGMTELSSQLWAGPGQAYRPPPWLRAIAIDPVTGQACPTGTPGQLRLYDLCNLDGSLAIETLDEGEILPDGRVKLYGRLTDAPARGCSLTVEEAWRARRRVR